MNLPVFHIFPFSRTASTPRPLGTASRVTNRYARVADGSPWKPLKCKPCECNCTDGSQSDAGRSEGSPFSFLPVFVIGMISTMVFPIMKVSFLQPFSDNIHFSSESFINFYFPFLETYIVDVRQNPIGLRPCIAGRSHLQSFFTIPDQRSRSGGLGREDSWKPR